MRLGDLSGPAHPNLPRRDCPVSWTHRSQLTRLHIDPLRQSTIAIRKEDAALYPGSYWSNVSDSPNRQARRSMASVKELPPTSFPRRTPEYMASEPAVKRIVPLDWPGLAGRHPAGRHRPVQRGTPIVCARPVLSRTSPRWAAKPISSLLSSGPAPGRRPALGGRHIVRTSPGLSSLMPGYLPGDSTRLPTEAIRRRRPNPMDLQRPVKPCPRRRRSRSRPVSRRGD